MSMVPRLVWLSGAACLFGHPARLVAQDLGRSDRERGLTMLRTVRTDVQRNYYDSTLHGANLAARWDSAEAIIRAAQSNDQIFGAIAW